MVVNFKIKRWVKIVSVAMVGFVFSLSLLCLTTVRFSLRLATRIVEKTEVNIECWLKKNGLEKEEIKNQMLT